VVAVGSDQRVTYAWTTGEVTMLSRVPALRNVVDGIGGTGTARTEETPTLERRYKPSGEKTKDPTERAANTADANIDDVELETQSETVRRQERKDSADDAVERSTHDRGSRHGEYRGGTDGDHGVPDSS
jgi:hypothetical protein